MQAINLFWDIVGICVVVGIFGWAKATHGEHNWGGCGELLESLFMGSIVGFVGGLIIGVILTTIATMMGIVPRP
jgi:hypothetical protein